MPTVILVRHGRTTANASGILAGRTPGVDLDDVGTVQAQTAGERLAEVRIDELVTSPQTRCRQTASALATANTASPKRLRVRTDKGVAECDYGDWQGRTLAELTQEPLWKVVQTQPSAAAFPGGESMRAMQDRGVAAIRSRDARLAAEVGDHAVCVVVSHGDLIKAILADALGMHLDLFQRIHVDPASISVIRYTASRPYVLATNTISGSLAWVNPPPGKAGSTDAAVGGGAGPAHT